ENMAHWLAEAKSTASTESTDIGMGHKTGIAAQNEIRNEWHQITAKAGECKTSNNQYKRKNGTVDCDPGTDGVFVGVRISYGTAVNVRLRFDADGKMTIEYYSNGNTLYVPPKTATAPAPSGGGTSNKDMKSTQDGRISLTPGSDVAKGSMLVV